MPEMLNIPGLEARTDNAFRWALLEQAQAAGLEPSMLAAVMRIESNFDPNIRNQLGAPAMGLIQFWKSFFTSVARKAGQPKARWEDLETSTALQQVPFVIAAFTGKRLSRSSSPTDYYMANFLPSFVGQPADFVLGEQGSSERLQGTSLAKSKIYEQNAGLDADGDGKITVGDVGAKINAVVDAARSKPPLEVTPEPMDIPPLVAPAPGSSSPGSSSPDSESPFSQAQLEDLAAAGRYVPLKLPRLRLEILEVLK